MGRIMAARSLRYQEGPDLFPTCLAGTLLNALFDGHFDALVQAVGTDLFQFVV